MPVSTRAPVSASKLRSSRSFAPWGRSSTSTPRASLRRCVGTLTRRQASCRRASMASPWRRCGWTAWGDAAPCRRGRNLKCGLTKRETKVAASVVDLWFCCGRTGSYIYDSTYSKDVCIYVFHFYILIDTSKYGVYICCRLCTEKRDVCLILTHQTHLNIRTISIHHVHIHIWIFITSNVFNGI